MKIFGIFWKDISPGIFFIVTIFFNKFQELFINFVGGVLFITTGALTIQETQRHRDQAAQMALGSLCIVAGILFLIDFLFSVKNTRVTVVTTSTTRRTI